MLGDVDADQVVVSATDGGGSPVPVAGLGFQGVFSYCDASPRSSAYSGLVSPYDMPTWQPGTTSGTLVGNAKADDTIGAAGWFQPSTPLKTLTFVFTRRSGFPVYQTWFAALPTTPPSTPPPSTSTTTSSTTTTSTTEPTTTTSTSTTEPTTTTSSTSSTTAPSTTTSSTTSTTSSTTTAPSTSSTGPGSTATTAKPPLPAGPGQPPIAQGPHAGGGRRLPATGRALGGLTLVGFGLVGAGFAALRYRRTRLS